MVWVKIKLGMFRYATVHYVHYISLNESNENFGFLQDMNSSVMGESPHHMTCSEHLILPWKGFHWI